MLNVLASGNEPFLGYDRALAAGQRNVTGLIEAIMTWCLSAEMMLIGLGRHHERHGLTYVSTHPGLLATDLHDHQGTPSSCPIRNPRYLLIMVVVLAMLSRGQGG